MKSNDTKYEWTFEEVRKLDKTLNDLADEVKLLRIEIKQKPLVVDNRGKTDWRAIAVLIGATIATILAAIQQVASR